MSWSGGRGRGGLLLAAIVSIATACGDDGTPPRDDAGGGGGRDAGGGGMDAGPRPDDAGSADRDAGGGVDAGVASDAGPDYDAGERVCPAVCPSGMCVNGDCVRRVFVTSEAISGGRIGGVAGANATCQRLADAAGLGGTYRAWLAEPLDWPERTFTRSHAPYVRVDGVLVAESWDDLVDGTLVFPILYTETGGAAPDMEPWANVNRDSTRHLGQNCGDWADDTRDAVGILGFAGAVAFGWTARDLYSPCPTPHPFYCFEQ